MDSEKIKKRFSQSVEITRLTGLVDRLPSQLSGGQQQRVALARSLAIRPSVLLLDEPLSNLDAKLRTEMRENISRIHRETGITTVYVTHDQKEALSMGTDVTVMLDGQEVQTGSPRELYRHPKSTFLASFIGETNIFEGIFQGKDNSSNNHLVKTAFGVLESNNSSDSFQKGERVHISIRPEAIRFDQKNHSHNCIKAKLQHAMYLGESEQLKMVCCDTQEEFSVNIFNHDSSQISLSSPIDCYIEPKDVILLPHQKLIK